jgi:membrane fusion protein, multidrug efflux system
MKLLTVFFRFILFMTAVAIASPLGAQGPEAKAKPLPAVVTARAKSMAIFGSFGVTGSIEVVKLAKLASPAEGPVLNCKVREGDHVRQGEILLKIGRTKSAEALLLSVSEDLRKEEEEAQRIEQLVQNGAIPGDQLGISRANLQKAKAQTVKVRESLDDYSVTAPWSGIVTKVLVNDGNFVSPRTPLIEIYDPTSLVLRFAVPEVQAAEVRLGMAVEFQLDAYPGKNLKAKVSRIYPELDRRMRTLTLEATPEEKLELIPGMFARLQVVTKSVPGATVIPVRAVTITPKGEKVTYVVQNGKSELRKIDAGIESRDYVEILKGVMLGEMVIIEGGDNLKDGAEVRVAGSENRGENPSGKQGQAQ